MAVSARLEARVKELFSGLGEIRVRRILGGAGIYCGDLMFGLIDRDEVVYLRAEGVVATALAAEGSAPFTYLRNGRKASMGFWRMPRSSWRDRDEAELWATRSLALAAAERRDRPQAAEKRARA